MKNIKIKKRNKFVVPLIVFVFCLGLLVAFSHRQIPEKIDYGVSFSKFHSDELGLDWKQTYFAILDELGVKSVRLSAHWPMIEPKDDEFNFSELDFQVQEAEKRNVDVILAIGKRLPGWPECHVPDWAKDISVEKRQEHILKYIETVVLRYKDSTSVKKWQLENELFLTGFAKMHCGELDKDFVDEEIALVKKLDSTRNLILTDSGEISTWFGPYKRADEFGTTMYIYVWNHFLGPIRYPITPGFFRLKTNIVETLFGKKKTFVAELGAEPWLLKPIVDTPISIQMERMGPDKFKNILAFSKKTGFSKQYLWGAEWWYWLKLKKHDDHWNIAKELFIQ